MNFSAVILAGGKSKRMGHDKTWLPVRGKPLIERQIECVRELGAKEIFISGRAGTDYTPLKCSVLMDHFADAGPLAGIERALAAVSTPLLLVLAVDMPRMNSALLQMLLDNCTENCGAIPRCDNSLEPLAAIYPRSALSLVTQLLQSQRLAARHFAERCVELNLAGCIDLPQKYLENFKNWNTPSDISDVND
ncbi:MAG TPA: molybdenum cofactor guanylyltransferase [Verrucomicrobiae bacterium]|jgi:molybdopterin-guanine dinucleotide biosynthesis protein A|nr:molybdenum cofactor guanylyltransferase [Verrucomicrobiae bacterium]